MMSAAQVSLRLMSLLVLVVVSLGLALSVAQPYTVCPSGCPFSKIQAALDAAKDGDTITVGPGVYKENLKITKSVSLVGADPAQVRLMPSGPAYALIQVGEESTLGTVRIEGFTLQQAIGLVEQAIYTEVDSSIQSFIFRNNRVLNREEVDWLGSIAGGEVTVEKNAFSSNSSVEIEGYRVRVVNNDLWSVRVNPSWGTGSEAVVEGNTFRLGDFGVLLMPGSGKFEFQGNKIIDNDLFGVLLAVPPCGEVVDPAKVQVTGSGNEIANNGKKLPPEAKALGDGEGNVCPKELSSLKK